ncbi:MAG TPA: aminotransferase class I/II-fold pyridoxal phosphate-dependent enzyme [Gammaproteobacteria bacterium]|nr:aminotransferase class I/II-fold pyridoxal phosphate-dependent enzyme [Gammaproteobacteria bacterium]
MSTHTSKLQQRLSHYKSQGLARSLRLPCGIDFSSNDYLGFAQEKLLSERLLARLQQTSVGATGSRLLRGNLALHEETEQILADFSHRETALLFPSGYMANLGLLSALLRQEDLVFSDALNHASIIDGIQLSKARKIIFPHRDYTYLEEQLKIHQSQKCLKVIVTESIFSMEGTKADLLQLAVLADRYQALFIVDEAHSTGIWGKSLVATMGLTEQVFASTHTAGKALGAAGAWVAGNHFMRDYLVHFARSFIFTTAPLPALAILLQEAIKLYDEIGASRAIAIRKRAQYLRTLLSTAVEKNAQDTPIISVRIDDNQRATRISEFLSQRGFDIRAIRPPTVPKDTARLRITVKWLNSEIQLQQLATDLLTAKNHL